jgi:hypothetical protein
MAASLAYTVVRQSDKVSLATFDDGLENLCYRNRMERVLVDTSRNLGEVFADYLNQRSRLNRGR